MRGPQGVIQSALSVGTSFLVGAVDPINVGSAFIPVMGELRYAKLLMIAGAPRGALDQAALASHSTGKLVSQGETR